MSKSDYSLMSGEPDRGTFVAYFLGAVVLLGGMCMVLGRYTALGSGYIVDPGITHLELSNLLSIHFLEYRVCPSRASSCFESWSGVRSKRFVNSPTSTH